MGPSPVTTSAMAPPGRPGFAPPAASGPMAGSTPGAMPPGPPLPGMQPTLQPPSFGGGMSGDGLGMPLSRAESVIGQFQSLTMNQGPVAPGQAQEVGPESAEFPRPIGPPDAMAQAYGDKINRDPRSCPAEFVRMTVGAIPNSAELKKSWCLPMSAVIQPLASFNQTGREVPVVNFGTAGIVRCRQCRTYINAYVQFVDGGRRWKCNVCGSFNEVPVEYFCTTDNAGVRRDIMERPELNSGTVEYVAPAGEHIPLQGILSQCPPSHALLFQAPCSRIFPLYYLISRFVYFDLDLN